MKKPAKPGKKGPKNHTNKPAKHDNKKPGKVQKINRGSFRGR